MDSKDYLKRLEHLFLITIVMNVKLVDHRSYLHGENRFQLCICLYRVLSGIDKICRKKIILTRKAFNLDFLCKYRSSRI
jgi:hypothetical protein